MDRANLRCWSNIQNDFSLTPTQLGLLFSIKAIRAYAASQIPVGYALIALASRTLMVVRLFCGVFLPFMMGSPHTIYPRR